MQSSNPEFPIVVTKSGSVKFIRLRHWYNTSTSIVIILTTPAMTLMFDPLKVFAMMFRTVPDIGCSVWVKQGKENSFFMFRNDIGVLISGVGVTDVEDVEAIASGHLVDPRSLHIYASMLNSIISDRHDFEAAVPEPE
jgi:hypothetical protein